MHMQENVNAICVMDYAVQNFGSENISTSLDGVIRCSIKAMSSGDIVTVSNMLRWADVGIKRSDKGLLVLVKPKVVESGLDHSYLEDEQPLTKKQLTVRDFFENLPQDIRINAFDNTAKSKWHNPVNSLEEAILTSFYISDSPQGANYWQDIILENS